MTKRDFFRVFIKIFGLYSLTLSVFSVIPNNISNLLFQLDWYMILMIIASTLISIGLFLVLFFRTDSIIKLFKLDKGFDDDYITIEGINNENILKLAILIIGGFLILDYIPSLMFDIINAFKYKSTYQVIEGSSIDYFDMTIAVLNIIIGYLFITNYKRIASFINEKT